MKRTDCWEGCYSNGWSHDDLIPEAFAHPAKKAKGLGIRIVEHALERGWIAPGMLCIDPFGGVATIALTLNLNGINYASCELEPRFVALAQSNLDLWRSKYGAMPGFGSARIVQGDSRRLVDVMREAGILRGADCCVSSPPYADLPVNDSQRFSRTKDDHRAMDGPTPYGTTTGQLGRMKEGAAPAIIVSSPPYVSGGHHADQTGAWGGKAQALTKEQAGYGVERGQLGKMKEGDAPALICSSPPYAGIATGAGGLNTLPGKDGQQSGRSADSASQTADSHYGEAEGQLSTMREGEAPACVISSPPYSSGEKGHPSIGSVNNDNWGHDGHGIAKRRGKTGEYGKSAGQLGAMPEGDVAAVISSPPFEGCHSVVPIEARARQVTSERVTGTIQYGATDGQIGNETGDTFWQAAREIVAQCHQILRPGGMAIWVCKDFVRKGTRVPFSDQWLALCESQGFELVCRHRAMLVEHGGTQSGLFGEDKELKVSRKSFFRRLAESKGSPEINWEDVICVRKPLL